MVDNTASLLLNLNKPLVEGSKPQLLAQKAEKENLATEASATGLVGKEKEMSMSIPSVILSKSKQDILLQKSSAILNKSATSLRAEQPKGSSCKLGELSGAEIEIVVTEASPKTSPRDLEAQ